MPDSRYSSLQLRVMSACVLAPIAIGALYFGGLYFAVFLGLASIAMSYEWCMASISARQVLFTIVMVITVLVSLWFSYYSALSQAITALICGAAVMALMGSVFKQGADLIWLSLGPFCIGLPVASLLIIRNEPDVGFALAMTLFFVIWATDIGAYFSGKTIGGPKIAPSISPNKTWAGLFGGMIAAMITAYGMVYFLINAEIAPFGILLLGGASAILAQAGDFSESAWKRKFGIKDASNLIPGHGGVLDRLDGVLFVAPGLMILLLLTSGN
ncbi:phosphatidate cytidylyltransferase [Sneathiella marina]|uniref:Phosphatidate cytidylyltransferase n=1 Tax=Sneathiella marina TaxID=2950108 RepID=A0ABY4VXG8_9PROT|nr:phosphatidate cytidylyltransferase [Sneathiella marina]USG59615.1 phosphatidate cytidylyltransferase [Sneathiella marina]